jgi:DNA-directed RNA polymerase specialized sigma24 family protein
MEGPLDLCQDPLPRVDVAALTPLQRQGWENHLSLQWREVSARLGRYLRRQGVPHDAVDDLLQDVALKVLERELPFEDAEDLLRWCYVVGRNLAVDRARRVQPSAEVAESLASPQDVHEHATHSIRWQAVLKALPQLSPTDRESLLTAAFGEQEVGTTRQEQVKLAVRRHRARSRLITLMGAAYALVLGWIGFLRRPRPTAALTAVPAALLVAQLMPAIVQQTSLPPLFIVDAEAAPVVGPAQSLVARPTPATVPVRGDAASVPPQTTDGRTASLPEQTAAPEVVIDGRAISITHEQHRTNDDRLLCVGGLPVSEICVEQPLLGTAAPDGEPASVLEVAGHADPPHVPME